MTAPVATRTEVEVPVVLDRKGGAVLRPTLPVARRIVDIRGACCVGGRSLGEKPPPHNPTPLPLETGSYGRSRIGEKESPGDSSKSRGSDDAYSGGPPMVSIYAPARLVNPGVVF